MSTIKPTSGIQYTGMTLNVAAGQLESTDSATGKSAAHLFADPAVTPLATPLAAQAAHFDASAPSLVEDQNLRRITQAIALRSDAVCAQNFSCGTYTRPTVELEAVLKSIAVSLSVNQPDFSYHG